MDYLLLSCSVFCVSSASIFANIYNRKTAEKNAIPLYNLLYAIATLVGWGVLFLTGVSFDVRVLPYSIIFALGYSVTTITMVMALKCGPMSITALISQLSILFVTVWGFIFWKQKVTSLVLAGICLVIVSLVLVLLKGKKEGGSKISLRWIILCLLMFAGNACCAIAQKQQQLDFDGKHGNMLMFFAMIMILAVVAVRYFICTKKEVVPLVKTPFYLPIGAGLFNVIHNLVLIILATSKISTSIVYSVLAVGGIMVTSLASILLFKEKLRWWQWIGIIVGAVAIVLISIG